MDTAYCIRCYREDLPTGQLCKRGEVIDNGTQATAEGLARYEGLCLRCCGHNHG